MAVTYLSLGSNIGDRVKNIRAAIDEIGAIDGVEIVKTAPLYETEPQGDKKDQPWFVNTAVAIKSEHGPLELLRRFKEIERKMGRAGGEPGGPRVIDIDMIFHDDTIISTDDLVIPHPRAADRVFVLKPLADISADVVHPSMGKSVRELLSALPGEGQAVKRIEP